MTRSLFIYNKDVNGAGVRRSKISVTLGGARVSTSYIYDSHGRLRTETVGTTIRRYLYSSDGIVGFEENGEQFLYRKNLFGDITAIDQGATKVAEYEYDAWGNCSITYNTNGIGTRNPFRYRGYYFDIDLNLYYLLTRYYDPKTGRFINADSLEYLDPNKINGLNLYAYCRNNPIMHVDPNGCEASSFNSDNLELLSIVPLLICLVYFVGKMISGETPEQPNSSINDVWDGDSLDIHWGKWQGIDFDPSGPILFPGELTLIDLEVAMGKKSLYIDSFELSSLYFTALELSAFAGADFNKNKFGIFANISILNLGYDSRYLDMELSLIGAGFCLGWNDGVFQFKADPWGWLGFGISIDIGQLISDFQ